MKKLMAVMLTFLMVLAMSPIASANMMTFHEVLGLSDMEEISSAVIVRNDGKCADIAPEDLQQWLHVYWNFANYERVIGPYRDDEVFREYYLKLWNEDKTKSFIVYPNSGVIVGGFGEPCLSHGEEKKNYVWYLPYIGNGRNALYTADTKLVMKYIAEQSSEFIGTLRDVTPDDAAVLPEENLLLTDGASDWAKEEIQKAAACNLLPFELTEKYKQNITRREFCDLIYRLIATEFVPESDSRMGQVAAIDGVIAERQLEDKVRAVSYSDYEHDCIRFLSAAGIIYGMGDGTFAPDAFLTREQAATILYRTAEFLGNKTMLKPSYETMYEDDALISDWAKSSVASMKAMEIMRGVSTDRFEPQGTYTTEQAIATMVRLYENNAFHSEKTDGALDNLVFADKLNAQMPTDKNYMFSPMSIKMALALAANGASGETQTEILHALGLSSLDEFNSISKDLIERYSQTDILSLNIANSIWMNKDKTSQNFSNSFKDLATEYYNADVKTIHNANAASDINSWVSDKTNGKIPTIIQNADDFWAMLINAIYFKGAWHDEFSERATKPDQFTNADGTKITIDFMNMTKWFPYAQTEKVQILELPYKNRVDKVSADGEYLGTDRYDDLDVSMYLVMADGDINVQQALSAAIADNAIKSAYIKMAMPKFEIEYSTSLNDMFMNMGITTAFDENNADFYRMFDKGNMWFTNTIHKTYISVDEKGTEAAAVTAIGMAGSALPPEPIELRFNKPFYFVIRDNTSGETLFMGRYAFAN